MDDGERGAYAQGQGKNGTEGERQRQQRHRQQQRVRSHERGKRGAGRGHRLRHANDGPRHAAEHDQRQHAGATELRHQGRDGRRPAGQPGSGERAKRKTADEDSDHGTERKCRRAHGERDDARPRNLLNDGGSA